MNLVVSVIGGYVNMASADEMRNHVCNAFSHLSTPFWVQRYNWTFCVKRNRYINVLSLVYNIIQQGFFLLAAYFPRQVLFASIGFYNCHLVCVLVACEVIYLITQDPITPDNVLAYWVLLLSTFAYLKHYCSSSKHSTTPIFNSRMATYLIMLSILFSIPTFRTTLIYYIL